jgi:oligogalacturonide lyase
MKTNYYLAALGVLLLPLGGHAQPRLATGAQKPMPAAEWIDADTGHKVVRLSQPDGQNASFYFHNNPFVKSQGGEDLMVIYHTDERGRQLRLLNLKTRQTEPLTRYFRQVKGEIVGRRRREVFYQVQDTVYATHVDSKKTRRVFVFPADFKADITSLNADETRLGGALGSDAEKEIYRQYPAKHDFFSRIYEARLPRTLFTVSTDGQGKVDKLFTDNAWLNHVQFSPTDPDLLMFCHEGPWEKVDRIWTIDTRTKAVRLVHRRTLNREIAGHEWFGADGQTIWFDHQKPRGETFAVTGTNLKTGTEKTYALTRDEWSVHYTSAADQRTFAGDGGYPTSVAKSAAGHWIYLFTPAGDQFKAEKLVNLQAHDYKLEPNVHFTPDGKWIVFRANFEGTEQVYAVEVEKKAS